MLNVFLLFDGCCKVKKVKHPKFHWKNKDFRITNQMKERIVLV